MDLTGRMDFAMTWLTQEPQGLGNFETYDQLVYHIQDRIRSGSQVQDLEAGVKKIQGQQTAYYWIEQSGVIVLGVESQIRPQGLVVCLTGKHPAWQGKTPWASDLYNIILQDNAASLRLISDNSLSDQGYAIWQQLLKQGHRISVYDRENPGRSFVTLDSLDDMHKYFAQDDTNFKRYQYVLSKQGQTLAETRSFFLIRRHRELVPGLL